ncbi:MAG: FAD-dependent oxidoreductase [Alphaproteobacteria bacterium]
MNTQIDIAVVGAGIAGLWVFHRLKRMGYDAVLLENSGIGGGQSIASQGILHSGLKYSLAGQVNDLARSISAMPDVWRDALRGDGDVDLSTARIAADSQHLLIPKGFMGGLVKLVTQKALGGGVHEVAREDWPDSVKESGFNGSVIFMSEPVLDVPSVIRALAEPYRDCIINATPEEINAKRVIYTAAASNAAFAETRGDDAGLKTQHRPLLQGMIKNAPYPLYAHLVGKSDKPVATITTHTAADGSLVWYLGAAVAERSKEADPQEVYDAAKAALRKYLPAVNIDGFEWAVLPIDRVEGKSATQNHLPDTPTLHKAGDSLYCWPTKLTFAPMLGDMVVDWLDIAPSGAVSDFSNFEKAGYAKAPWDMATWKSDA